jgi:hypothetical protein
MKDIIDLVKPPRLENNFLDELKKRISQRLGDVSLADAKFKLEPKCILFVCVLIESALAKDTKIDKRGFLIDIFQQVYGLSEDDKVVIRNTCDMLHLTGKIKKKNYYKLYCTSVLEIFRL